jgi:hypothetical protein
MAQTQPNFLCLLRCSIASNQECAKYEKVRPLLHRHLSKAFSMTIAFADNVTFAQSNANSDAVTQRLAKSIARRIAGAESEPKSVTA